MSEHFEFTCSASIMCANLLRLEEDVHELEGAGIDELHFDIMDGIFVPNLTLGFDIIKQVRGVTSLPINAHLMIQRPERYVERFVNAGCTSLTVHVEACPHANRVLQQIREAGASPGIAINPATPLTKLEYLLKFADRVLLMTVDPGYAGQSIIHTSFERTRILRQNLEHRELQTKIEVDGNINSYNAAFLSRMGATNFVLGTSSLFVGRELSEALYDFKEAVATQRHLV